MSGAPKSLFRQSQSSTSTVDSWIQVVKIRTKKLCLLSLQSGELEVWRKARMRRQSIIFLFITLILLPFLSHSFSSINGHRLLVLLDDPSLQSSHSIFFNSLISRGFHLDFKLADDPNLTLQRYGNYLYDGLVLFSPTAERKCRTCFFLSYLRKQFSFIVISMWLFVFFYFGYTGLGGSLDLDAVVDYVDSGHDLILAASASASDLIRNIATECGVDFDDVGLQCFLIYASVCFFLECVLLYCFVCVMV